MRALVVRLLERELQCQVATEVDSGSRLRRTIERTRPDLVAVDVGDFPACCHTALEAFPRDRVVVVSPEPDTAYWAAALANGAGAWLPRERVGDELPASLRKLAGCRRDACPPGDGCAGPARRCGTAA